MAEPIFSERTRIALPIALQMTLLASVIGCTATVVWAAQSLKSQLDANSDGLEMLKSEMYPMAVASEQALRTAIENPGMRVPDPRDPNRIIVVEGRK